MGPEDIRGRGFADCAPLSEAFAWLDAQPSHIAVEHVASTAALGRILSAPITATSDLPPDDRASADGYAVAAEETAGASAYNPLSFVVDDTPGAGRAVLVCAGARMPDGTDVVLGFTTTEKVGERRIEVLTPAAPGEGVEQQGSALGEGKTALTAGHKLAPQDLALLAMLGRAEVEVCIRPRVGLVLPGPKGADAEALLPMLAALIARDGGEPLAALASLALPPSAGILIIAGRSGAGMDDDAAPALIAAGGELALHGLALRPGGSAGLGMLQDVPALLLPGEPRAAFVAYDVLAARLLRRLAGLARGPYPSRSIALRRKIVSAIGFVDVVPVAIADGQATPLGSAESARLPAACTADGFVIVPEALEGYPPGSEVTVHLYAPGNLLL